MQKEDEKTTRGGIFGKDSYNRGMSALFTISSIRSARAPTLSPPRIINLACPAAAMATLLIRWRAGTRADDGNVVSSNGSRTGARDTRSVVVLQDRDSRGQPRECRRRHVITLLLAYDNFKGRAVKTRRRSLYRADAYGRGQLFPDSSPDVKPPSSFRKLPLLRSPATYYFVDV